MLAIAGGKGGCGKTTTALGVAAALPGRPVVADADWDLPNLHRLAATYREDGGAGKEPERDRATSRGDVMPLRVDGLGDLAVLPAPETPANHEVSRWLHRLCGAQRERDRGRDRNRERWRGRERERERERDREEGGPAEVSPVTRPETDRVLVDCPAGASPDATAPLSVADATLLVTTPQPAAVRDAMKTAAMARALGAPPVGAVVVGADSPPDGIRAALDAPVAGCIPSVPPPVLAHREVASAYRAVASRVRDARPTEPANP